MAIITLLTDFGEKDHYVAAVKGTILSENPAAHIIDISHHVPLSDIAACALTARGAYRSFPNGTVHVIGVQKQVHNQQERMIAAKVDKHYFVLPDNGLLSLIIDKEPEEVIELEVEEKQRAFVCRDVLAVTGARLSSGVPMKDLGKPAGELDRLVNRAMRATIKQIAGHVMKVDHYGNLITNIEKEAFDIITQKVADFTIIFGRERFGRIHNGYNAVEAGEIFVIFNSQGLLEIGINQGNAEQLLGLSNDSPVLINFTKD